MCVCVCVCVFPLGWPDTAATHRSLPSLHQGWTADLQDVGARASGGVLVLTKLPENHSLAPLIPSVCGAVTVVAPPPPVTGAGAGLHTVDCGAVSGPAAILHCGGFAAILPLMWPLGTPCDAVQRDTDDGSVGGGGGGGAVAATGGDAIGRRQTELRRWLKLVRLLLLSSAALRADFKRCGGFELFGWVLRQIPKAYFNKECLIEVVQMVEWLMQKKKLYCSSVYRHTPSAAAAATAFASAAAQVASATEGTAGAAAAANAMAVAADQLDPIFEQSRLNAYCELCLCMFHYVVLDLEIWAECLPRSTSCDGRQSMLLVGIAVTCVCVRVVSRR